jgi:hypothetical protein
VGVGESEGGREGLGEVKDVVTAGSLQEKKEDVVDEGVPALSEIPANATDSIGLTPTAPTGSGAKLARIMRTPLVYALLGYNFIYVSYSPNPTGD